jgi:hypothetical protein
MSPYNYPHVLCFRLLNIGLRDRLLCPLLPSDTTSEIDCGSEALLPRWLNVVKEMVCGHVGLVIGPRQLRTTPHCQPSFIYSTAPEDYLKIRRGTARGGHASTACLLNIMPFAMLLELLKAIFFHPLFQAQWQGISSSTYPDRFTGR